MPGTPDERGLRHSLLRDARRLVADADAAEDLVQECLVVLHTRGEAIRDRSKTRAWCRTVLRNLLLQRRRRRSHAEIAGLTEHPEDPWRAVDARLMLETAIDSLPDGPGRVVRDFYFGGRTIRHIAADEQRPVGTIKRWLHEGREALRMSLSETTPNAPLARVYASNWLDDARRNVEAALDEAGFAWEASEISDSDDPPLDADLYVLGHDIGCRSGLELLLYLRCRDETADRPVLLFGPGRDTAVFAAWKAGADVYLTDPSSPEVGHFLGKLREPE